MESENSAAARHQTFRFAALWAAVITTVCVVIGQSAARFASITPPPVEVAAAHNALSAKKPVFNAIDYATTSAIKGQTVVIAPCQR